ncbi:MAG: hypothetical protein ACXWP4_04710, partial [Polyangiales bacterium]
ATADAPADTATDTTPAIPAYDAGAPPAVDPYANDIEIAFGTLSVRRVTRLRADLPTKTLDSDLQLEADDAQNLLSQYYYPTKRANEACASGPAVADSSTDTCSCTVPDSESSPSTHVAIAAAALACAFIRRKRR